MANIAAINQKQPGRAGVGGVVNSQAAEPSAAAKETQNRINYLIDPTNYRNGDAVTRPVATEVRTRAGEILPQLASSLSVDLSSDGFMSRAMSKANATGMTLSEFLEVVDPSDRYTGAEREMDAFERQLMIHGIRTKSVPGKGIYADNVQRFFESNQPGSQVLFPEFINRTMREGLIAPDTLQYMLALRTGTDGSADYRTIYTNESEDDRRLVRVGEGADFPTTVLSTAEHALRIQKYGRKFEGSYEFFSKVRIDLFAIMLRRTAMQNNLDKADFAAYVAINGDGNGNAATNYNQGTLDTGTTPTYKAFIAFCMKFYPYQLNTLIGNATSLVNFLAMSRPSIDPFQVLALLQQNYMVEQQVQMPQGIYTNIRLLLLPNMTDGIYLGLDNRFALEEVSVNGSNLVETDKFVATQRNILVISERNGYGKIFNEANRTWTWNA
jgi:hypothetical protein